MPTLTPTSTSTSNKTVVAFAVLGGVAMAAMLLFGFSAKKKGGQQDMWTPGYSATPEIYYRPIGETPIIEEQKPRPTEPEVKMEVLKANEGLIDQNGVMLKTDTKLKR